MHARTLGASPLARANIHSASSRPLPPRISHAQGLQQAEAAPSPALTWALSMGATLRRSPAPFTPYAAGTSTAPSPYLSRFDVASVAGGSGGGGGGDKIASSPAITPFEYSAYYPSGVLHTPLRT